MFRSNRVGPHKARECLPLCLILRNRLKYALTYKEVTTILMQRCVKVDGKIRLDKCYPCGIMGTLFFYSLSRFIGDGGRRGASGGVGCSAGSMAAENPRRKRSRAREYFPSLSRTSGTRDDDDVHRRMSD